MLYLNFDHPDIRIRNAGIARWRCLRITAIVVLLLLTPCWMAKLYISIASTPQAYDANEGAMALQQSMKELAVRRASHRAHEIRQEQLARVYRIRWNVVVLLEALPFLLPDDASLSEVSLLDQAIRLRGIAADGGAIQILIERFRRAFGSSECVVESVRRAQERDRWRDEFAITVSMGAHS